MIKTILHEAKSEKECSELLKDLISSAEKNETIIHLPNWGNIYPKEKLVDAISNTKLVAVDRRHINEDTFALESQDFWEVVFDPDSPTHMLIQKTGSLFIQTMGGFRHRRKLAFSLWKNKRLKVAKVHTTLFRI